MSPMVTGPKEFEAVGNTGAQAEQTASRAWLYGAAPWICVAVTLSACLIQNVVFYGTRANLFWDAAHYIDSSRDLAASISHLLSGGAAGSAELWHRAGQKVLLDGPILPVLGAAAYLALGKVPAYDNLITFVFIQSLLQSLGASLACMLAGRLMASSRWGLAGGLAWGLYPSAVIATGIYMSETVTTVLLLSLTAVACVFAQGEECGQSRPFALLCAGLGFGILAGLLLLTKPALIFAAAWVGLITLVLARGNRLRLTFAAAALVGSLMVVACWAAFTLGVAHRIYLTPQRVPTHNMVMGFDTETDGFGTGPASPLDELYRETDGPLPVAAAQVKAHPAEVANLLVRRPERMWALPWNDLRRAFLGVPAICLVWWHQVLIITGLLGGLAVISQPDSSTTGGYNQDAHRRAARLVGWSASGIVLCHLIYTVFEAIPRYGFTAMPFFCMLSVFWLCQAIRFRLGRQRILLLAVPAGCCLVLSQDLIPYVIPIAVSTQSAVWLETGIKVALILAAAAVVARALRFPGESSVVRAAAVTVIALFAITALCAHAVNPNAVREWQSKLKPGQAACRQISLASGPYAKLPLGKPDWAAVLLDTDRHGVDARVSLNGRLLPGGPRSAYWYDPAAYDVFFDMEQKATLLHRKLDSFRQWRVVHVPVDRLSFGGANLIAVQAPDNDSATVFGDYSPATGRKRVLSSAFAAGRIWSSNNSLESRGLSAIPAAPVQARSWMQGTNGKMVSDLSSSPGVQTGDYRIHLLLGYRRGSTDPRSGRDPARSPSAFEAALPAEAFDPPLPGSAGVVSAAGKPVWHRKEVIVEKLDRGMDYSLLRITGQARATGSDASASIALVLKGAAQTAPVILPGTLGNVTGTATGRQFEITQELPYWLPKTGLSAVQVEVHSGPKVIFKDLKLEIEPVSRPDLSSDRFLVL